MVHLTKLRDLTGAEPSAPGRPLHISAASGLVDLGGHVAVIADDELQMGWFSSSGSEPGRLNRLFGGVLPAEKAERKKRKPDIEVLTHFRSAPGYPNGILLAMGSGSTPDRCKGVTFQLDTRGQLNRPPAIIDFQPLFDSLRGLAEDLNIEGATIQGREFRLFHRGNNSFPASLVVRLPLTTLLTALASGRMESVEPLGVHRLDLGRVQGVPFSVTDASALPDGRTVITAVAEDTGNAYSDGACLGALIGVVDHDMRVARTWPIDPVHKVEGVSASVRDNRVSLLLVVDADDPDVAASLFTTTIDP